MVMITCITVKKVFLYWAAADFEEDNIANEANWDFKQLKIMLPGSSVYSTITADNVIFRGKF